MIRKLILCGVAAAALSASGANAATIVGLFNTGVNVAGTGLKPGNGADLHWDVTGSPQAFTSNSLHPAWLADGGASRWVVIRDGSVQGNTTAPAGSYAYYLDFNIGSAFNASTASFAGRFAADNLVSSITLNGNTITGSGGNFNNWTNFSATGGFVQGANQLVFNVTNLPCIGCQNANPSGLRVEFLNSNIAAVPEPATWAMMIGGFGMIGASMRRRRQQVRVTYA